MQQERLEYFGTGYGPNGFVVSIRYLHLTLRVLFHLLLSRSRLCHYSVGGSWWHLGFYESF
jgi:hypothetical protein